MNFVLISKNIFIILFVVWIGDHMLFHLYGQIGYLIYGTVKPVAKMRYKMIIVLFLKIKIFWKYINIQIIV